MREVREYVTRKLSQSPRIEYNNECIVEKVWISDIDYMSSNILYSGCYIKKWYHFEPKLRLMTTNGIVETIEG
jgi:hypothetical protein